MASAGLHGSSIRIYGWMYGYSPVRHLPLLGKPKGIRVDEWNYHTPTILNQLLRPDRFAADSSLFGPDKAALFANVPTRHWSEWFRPQFWFFHCLPLATAYAFYWQTKGLLLLTGIFSLLLLTNPLQRSRPCWVPCGISFRPTRNGVIPGLAFCPRWWVCLVGSYVSAPISTIGRNPLWLTVAAVALRAIRG